MPQVLRAFPALSDEIVLRILKVFGAGVLCLLSNASENIFPSLDIPLRRRFSEGEMPWFMYSIMMRKA
jgi:hypothetical protein